MSQPFVTFPGTAGNYISTADVNLLDADTAHIYQSIGQWQQHTNADGIQKSATESPVFGGLVQFDSVNGDLTALRNSANTTGANPVSAATEYSFSQFVASDDRTMQVLIREFNAAGATLATTTYGNATSCPLPDGAVITGTFTTAPTTATIAMIVAGTGGNPDERCYVGASMLCLGSDATFVPSLRIVSDLDLRIRCAMDDWTDGSNRWALDSRSGALTGFYLRKDSSGFWLVSVSNGSSDIQETWVPPWVDGEAATFRVTWDVSATTGAVKWYYNDTLDETDDASLVSAIQPGGALFLGSEYTNTNHFDGNVYWAEVRDGIGGPVVARFDAGDVLRAL